MVTAKQVLGALKAIIDPDLKRNIVDLNFVKNLKIDRRGNVSFEIWLTTPACPVKDQFEAQARELLKAIKGVRDIKIKLLSQRPSASVMSDELRKTSGLQEVGSLIAVSSCKGGVGKSTLSVAIARNLVERGHHVGLLDADIYGPSIPTLLRLRQSTLEFNAEKKILPYTFEGLKVMSFGFISGESPAVMRGPMVSNYLQQLLHGVAWGALDYLVVDMPPGTGDIQLTMTQSIRLQGALIVTTPHALSFADVGKGILMFNKVRVPVLGVVENMAYYTCGRCGEKQNLFGYGASQDLTKRFGIPLIGRLPLDVSFGQELVLQDKKPLDDVIDTMIRHLGKSLLKTSEANLPRLQYDQQHIRLYWPLSKEVSYSNKMLRYYCMSAKNVNEVTGERMLKWEDIITDIQATSVEHLGNYAITITWNDGHRSIFSYEYLDELHRVNKEKALPS